MLRPKYLLYLLAIIKFALPFFLQDASWEPHRDELLYLAEGNHMAWGFMEVPPMLSIFAWLTQLLGGGFFWIKCWPSLFGALTFLLTGRMILHLGGKSFALILGFLPFITGAYLRMHFLFQPNFLEIFFWTLIAYCLIRFVQTRETKWIYFFGISAGLAMLSKYSVAFFIISLLAGLALTPGRTLFRNKHLYGAAALGLLLFLPNLVWQWINHFPVVFHMKELRERQLQYVSPIGFLVDQLLMNLATVFIWLAGLIFTLRRSGHTYRFVGWAYLLVIALLLVTHGKNYYAMGAYPILFAFGAWRLEFLTSAKMRWILRPIFLVFSLGLGLYILPIALPIYGPEKLVDFYARHNTAKTGALKWEDQKNHPLPQDFSDMQGWKEAANKMHLAYNSLTEEEKKHTILFCDNYGLAGAVNYYRHEFPMPEPYSTNASFLYWIPDSLNFDNLILLADDPHEMEHPFIKNFQSATLFDSITTTYARERGDLIVVFKGGNDKFKKMFSEKINRARGYLKKTEASEHGTQ